MKTKVITKSTENQKDVVCFYRVSTSSQDNLRQFDDVRRYAKAYSYNIVKEFEETVSGKAELSDRSELKAMLTYINENPPQYVIVSELSRLGRSNLTLDIIEKLTKAKICFISLKEGIKTLTDDGTINPTTQLVIDILNGINKFELETIKFRVKSGLRKTANKGTWIGSVPFGYSKVGKESEARLVINPDESLTLKMMFEKYSEGWSNNKIASHLNRNSIKTKMGKTWKDTAVYKILKNSIACGKRVWGGEITEMPELRIIDDSVFASVQDRLTKNQNVTPINKHYKNDYLLTGLIHCSCGKHFTGQGRVNRYQCKSNKYSAGCNIKSIKIDYLDEEIKKKLFVNYSKMLNDSSAVINRTVEMKEELLHLLEKIADEKETQNYLINNMVKIGQQKFDEKFDASTALVKQMQIEVDAINIKLSNTKIFMQIPAVGIIKPELQNEIIKGDKKIYTTDIFSKVTIDKKLVQKVVETINIDNEQVQVILINGDTFIIKR